MRSSEYSAPSLFSKGGGGSNRLNLKPCQPQNNYKTPPDFLQCESVTAIYLEYLRFYSHPKSATALSK